MTVMNDQVAAVAYGFDDYITELSHTHGIDVLSLTSIILARLILINDYAGCGPEFRTLLADVATIKPHEPAHGVH